MASDQTRDDLLARLQAQLAAREARLAARQAEIATLQTTRRQPRWRVHRRGLPRILAALLVALVPLATLAADVTDRNPGSPHNDNIAAMAAAGIARGCNPPAFDNHCPNGLVTREEMASFLASTAGVGSTPPVVKAKTAQTATGAQAADIAANATNAGRAGSAAA